MKLFLFTMLGINVLCFLVGLLHLATEDYPRRESTTRGLEAVRILVALAICAWIAALLGGAS